ncbi:EAL domain-containing protein [Aerosakkonemataceae cyanobacterium BLCC-F50]|uniref:EAL domain-containing protein n=1 Tax=Floridaenema flaviceps BLCC-F50 TaxID=3153642 RepID=A0ABV4XVN2_9CYAN
MLDENSEVNQTEKFLKQTLEQLTFHLENSPVGVVEWDNQSRVKRWSKQAEKIFGWQAEEVLGKCWDEWQFVFETDVEGVYENAVSTRTAKDPINVNYNRNYTKDGRILDCEWYNSALLDEFGNVVSVLSLVLDVSDRKQAEAELKKSEEQFRLIFELAPIGMALTTLNGQFLRVNVALCNCLGYSEAELLQLTLIDIIHPDYLANKFNTTKELFLNKAPSWQVETCYSSKSGNKVYAILQVSLVKDTNHKPLHYIVQVVNITERKEIEEKLLHDAFHDVLTGLPNRKFLNQRLEYTIRRAKRYETYLFAVLFIDLDRFKVVNDSLGHAVGDQLLIEVANLLEKSVRNIDTVARLGGDEFVILLDGLKDIQDATIIAQRIEEMLRSPFQIAGQEVFTSASIGIALSTTGYEQGADMLRDGDIAMYRAKDLGKARYQIFDKAMHAHVLRIMQLETDMRKALERQEFIVYYQPIVSLKTGAIAGFEALVRWQHPDEGLVSPAEFIPLAEETGLIVPLGKFILAKACHQMYAWQVRFPHTKNWKISVNLSTKQLKDGEIINQIDRILQETHLNSNCLKLEITESVLMENAEVANSILLQLRNRDIQLSIDDFGTGYSSLSYLHRFPVNTLKIDRSFVNLINPNDENLEIVRAIVTLAHILGMDVVAEGIETSFQLAQLKELGCEQGQGFYFSKALDYQAATALIISQQKQPKWGETVNIEEGKKKLNPQIDRVKKVI